MLPRLGSREVKDADGVASGQEEGECPGKAVSDGPQPAEPLAAPHQVAHVAVGCVTHAVPCASVPAVYPHNVQEAPAVKAFVQCRASGYTNNLNSIMYIFHSLF